MARVIFDIPDVLVPELVEAFTKTYGYAPKVPNPQFDINSPESAENPKEIANPETDRLFTANCIRRFAKDVVIGYKTKQADVVRQQIVEQATVFINANEAKVTIED